MCYKAFHVDKPMSDTIAIYVVPVVLTTLVTLLTHGLTGPLCTATRITIDCAQRLA
jgi:hypothetical protein